jgi:hypothetical protein
LGVSVAGASVSLFLDALSDAASQVTETLASVAHAFGAGWGRGLEALLNRPAALFYLAAFVAGIVFIMGDLRGARRAGYQRGRFLTANEKSFLMALPSARTTARSLRCALLSL